MNRLVKYKRNSYTLVELMIAMAILVIMMGFLFQFLNSAQRLWSASSNSSQVFDTAQIVFDILETDLKNAVFSAEPGREVPFYRQKSGTVLTLGFYTHYISSTPPETVEAASPEDKGSAVVEMYPILYVFDSDPEEKKFFRLQVDCFTVGGKNILLWEGVGCDASSNVFDNLKTDLKPPPPNNEYQLFDVLAEGVEDIDIIMLPNVNGYASEKPKAVKISLSLYDPAADQLEAEAKDLRKKATRRTFSKVVFL